MPDNITSFNQKTDEKVCSLSFQHLTAEMRRIDLLLSLFINQSLRYEQERDEYDGICITKEEIAHLLSQPVGIPLWAVNVDPPFNENSDLDNNEPFKDEYNQLLNEISEIKRKSLEQGITLRLESLTNQFQLTDFDTGALLICMISTLDRKYEKIFGYLQNDITRKRPNIDLVLNLFCRSWESKLNEMSHFRPNAPLIFNNILELQDYPDDQNALLLNKYLKVDSRIIEYLLGNYEIDERIKSYIEHIDTQTQLEELLLPQNIETGLTRIIKAGSETFCNTVFYLHGPYGVGKLSTARALCAELNNKTGFNGLLIINLPKFNDIDHQTFTDIVRFIIREAKLQNAPLYWRNFDLLSEEEDSFYIKTVNKELLQLKSPLFLSGSKPWEPDNALHNKSFIRIELNVPGRQNRLKLWEKELGNGKFQVESDLDVKEVSNKFNFSGGQIIDTAFYAGNFAGWRDPKNKRICNNDLIQACKQQSNLRLPTLAQRIEPHYSWEDIVLPKNNMEMLKEICNHVNHRDQVFNDWGFGAKLSLGKGLNILFSGPPGTGKTMAAEVIAGELGLNIYKIDIASMVSKYIGETEKNLACLFSEAENTDVMLFFDEADALFGKRTEVRSSHDRHANVETGFLLQKMEEHRGIVVLATNLRKNMDDAFLRRINFTMEFAMPDEEHRLSIWQGIWPDKIPLCSDIDPQLLANRFEISGANIRNIAVMAAFLSAEEGTKVELKHLMKAARREYQKIGEMIMDDKFLEHDRK